MVLLVFTTVIDYVISLVIVFKPVILSFHCPFSLQLFAFSLQPHVTFWMYPHIFTEKKCLLLYLQRVMRVLTVPWAMVR